MQSRRDRGQGRSCAIRIRQRCAQQQRLSLGIPCSCCLGCTIHQREHAIRCDLRRLTEEAIRRRRLVSARRSQACGAVPPPPHPAARRLPCRRLRLGQLRRGAAAAAAAASDNGSLGQQLERPSDAGEWRGIPRPRPLRVAARPVLPPAGGPRPAHLDQRGARPSHGTTAGSGGGPRPHLAPPQHPGDSADRIGRPG